MTMGSGKSALIALLMIAGLSQSARATTFTVGGTTGWTLGIGATFYDDWAKSLTFNANDILDFTYPGATHNVFEVSAADLASCNLAAPIKQYDTLGGALVPLTKTGTHYFICGIPGHCAAFMKMTIVVNPPALSPAALNKTAPAAAPASVTSTVPLKPTPSGPTVVGKSGASSHRSEGPAMMIIGAILSCAFAPLLF